MDLDMSKMMEKAQQMMQAQQELAAARYDYSGNGVKVVISGDMNLVSIDIEEELIKSAADDKEMLEDCIMVAITAAMKKAKDESAAKMSDLTGGLNIPGLNL